MSTIALTPRQPVPLLSVPLVNAGPFDLRAQAAEKFAAFVREAEHEAAQEEQQLAARFWPRSKT
jgi:hypothetical protein